MRTAKPLKHAGTDVFGVESDMEAEFADEEGDADVVRVVCPDCARPIALAGPDEEMPQHALCPTPWNPFGLTLCPGSGRTVSGTGAARVPDAPDGGDATAPGALPEGLDWRLQPFSHAAASGAGMRQAA
ncbi:hypothetical protein [Streptomyces sp. SBT349]|uniref:hypothetical protein n=1 Tax=Streptomyces sp. SBT349 TaxID=1580539 RepID=UPI0007C7FCDC|nr:hypothetical protein [Streptomyces sp. SBT349]